MRRAERRRGGDGHHDDCMFTLFSKVKVDLNVCRWIRSHLLNENPYLTDYIVYICLFSKDLLLQA